MTQVRLRSLGECAIETDATRVGPDARFVFAAALYLVLERGKRIPRQALIDLLWPDVESEQHARHRFRQTLLRLKQSGVPITAGRNDLMLPRDAAESDFEKVIESNGETWMALRGRGSYEFLPGYAPQISPEFDAWIELHRSRVQTAIQRIATQSLHVARTKADWPEVERIAGECLRLDPFHEEATMASAEAAVMRGSKMQALQILDVYMDALGEKSASIGLPAKLLRSRIAERVNQPKYAALSERHFVGREAEMAQLTAMLDEARAGRGGGCLIWGEPGIGKTRLLQEISTVAQMKGVRVVTVRCQPPDVDRPLSAFADAIPVLRALPGALGISPESLAMLQRLSERDRNNSAAPPTDPTDAEFLNKALRRALFDLLDAVLEENCLLFALEDVQWLDSVSWAMLKDAIEWSPRRRFLILATSRIQKSWTDGVDPSYGYTQLRVAPLKDEASAGLLAEISREQASDLPPGMQEWCVDVAEGNPFFLRELVTHWAETQRPYDVPRSLADLIARRVQHLDQRALQLLQLCATLGGWCTLERLERTRFSAPADLLVQMDILAAVGMVVVDGETIRVRHDLLAQAALARLSAPTRQILHRQVAKVLEDELKHSHTPAILWECAHHWESAGSPTRAVQVLDECAQHLLRVGLPGEAVDLYDRALRRGTLPRKETVEVEAQRLLALRVAGGWNQISERLEELQLAFAEILGIHSPIELLEIESRFKADRITEPTLQQLVVCIAASECDPNHQVEAASWLLAGASNFGYNEFAESARHRIEALISASEGDPVVRMLVAMIYHTDYGDLATAAAYADSLIAECRLRRDPIVPARALRNAAMTMWRIGDFGMSRQLLEETRSKALQHGRAVLAKDAAMKLGLLFLYAGDFATSDRWMTIGEARLPLSETVFTERDYIADRIVWCVCTGHVAQARALLRRIEEPGWEDRLSPACSQEIASLILMLAALEDAQINPNILALAESLYLRFRHRGNQDLATYALALSYKAIGRENDVMSLVQEYLLTFRRDRGPLLPPLSALAEALGLAYRAPDQADAMEAATRG